MDCKRFVRFKRRITIHQHRDLHRRVGWPEGQRRSRNRGVVARSYRRSVHRLVVHRGTQRRAATLGHCEDVRGRARIAFVVRHVINREARRRLIVDNRACAIGIADRRAARVAQVDRERFVRLKRRITVHQHRDLLGRLVGSEVERPAIRLVVVVRHRGRSVHRLEVHRRTERRRAHFGDRENVRGATRSAFVLRHVIDHETRHRVVVHDCAGSISRADCRVDGRG